MLCERTLAQIKLEFGLSSINPYFTFTYSQPKDYRFSHDSVFLSRRVFEFFAVRGKKISAALDLCAGCGIVGLDFMAHCDVAGLTSPAWDFLEVQAVYEEHFRENARRFAQTRFLNMNYAQLMQAEFAERYDLIVSNPPYFAVGSGRLSPSDFKNRCRFFIDSDFPTLIRAVLHGLKPGGTAFLLVRSLKEHGFDREHEVEELTRGQALAIWLEPIRGTPLLQISKSV